MVQRPPLSPPMVIDDRLRDEMRLPLWSLWCGFEVLPSRACPLVFGGSKICPLRWHSSPKTVSIVANGRHPAAARCPGRSNTDVVLQGLKNPGQVTRIVTWTPTIPVTVDTVERPRLRVRGQDRGGIEGLGQVGFRVYFLVAHEWKSKWHPLSHWGL